MTKNVTALAASLLLLASCTEEVPVNPGSGDAIAFGTVSTTRGAVTSADQITDFKVYAKKFPTGSVDLQQVSDVFYPNIVQTVTKQDNGTWTYPDQAYWLNGNTYSFLSLYPSSVKAANVVELDNGNIAHYLTISGYQVGKDEDLMMGVNHGIEASKDVTPGTVDVQFRHLLSQVDFVVKADAETVAMVGAVKVTSAKFYGTHATGDYSGKTFTTTGADKGTWTLTGNVTTVDNPTADNSVAEVPTGGVSLFGKSFILFPAKEPAKVVLTYTIGSDPTELTYEQDLSLLTPLGWEAGKSYRYTITIVDKEHILFDVPTVQPWSKGTGGIIIVE